MAARRRPWLAWLPAVILSVVIVGVLVVAGVLLQGGLGKPTPKPTEGQVTDLNWSSFTETGLDYIRSSRDVRIDLSRPPVEAAAIGLEPDATLVLERIDNLDVQLDYDLILNGGGEAPGGLRLTASEIRITTAGGLVTRVEADLVDVLPFRQALDRFERESATSGWTLDRDAIFAMVEEATRAGEPYEVAVGPSDRLGLALSATAACDTSGYCALTYSAAPVG